MSENRRLQKVEDNSKLTLKSQFSDEQSKYNEIFWKIDSYGSENCEALRDCEKKILSLDREKDISNDLLTTVYKKYFETLAIYAQTHSHPLKRSNLLICAAGYLRRSIQCLEDFEENYINFDLCYKDSFEDRLNFLDLFGINTEKLFLYYINEGKLYGEILEEDMAKFLDKDSQFDHIFEREYTLLRDLKIIREEVKKLFKCNSTFTYDFYLPSSIRHIEKLTIDDILLLN